MSPHPPPATPRRSTRVRAGASKLPCIPSNAPADPANEVDCLPLSSLKLTTSNSLPKSRKTRPNTSNHHDVDSKTPVYPEGSNQSNSVENITKRIQDISIDSHPPNQKLSTKLSSSEATTAVSLPQRINAAMKTVNLNLTKLSSIRQAGWKAPVTFIDVPSHSDLKNRAKEASNDAPDGQLEQALEAIDRAHLAIQTLRKLISNSDFKHKSYDTERAGLALVNHAIELGLYNSALRLLEAAHNHLQALMSPCTPAPLTTDDLKPIKPSAIPPSSWESFSKVMSFLVPKGCFKKLETMPNQNNVALVIMTAAAQGFLTFLNGNSGIMLPTSRVSIRSTPSPHKESSQSAKVRADCCLRAFGSSKGLVQWVLSLNDPLPGNDFLKKILGAVQACYSVVVRYCSAWEGLLEPGLLFQLRKSAILLLLTCQVGLEQLTPSDTSIDQARRTLLLYARSRPNQLAEVVSEARVFFAQIVQIVQGKETPDGSCITQNTGWKGLCEVVIGLARKVDDIELVNQTGTLLIPKQDIHSERNIGLLLAHITVTSNALDHYFKTDDDKDIVSILEKSKLTIAALVHRRDTLSIEQVQKMDVSIDRLRRVCVRVLRKAMADEAKPITNNIPIACCSVSQVIIDSWAKEIEKQANSTDTSGAAIMSMMITGATESLLALAENSFQVKHSDSNRGALTYLSRCAPLLQLLPEPDVSVIRGLTSTYYNAGVALYHADKLANAIDFVRPACEIPNQFFNLLQDPDSQSTWFNFKDLNGELEVLRRQLLKRWELLALCYLQIDKSLSHQAYVSAIRSYPSTDFQTLEKIADDGFDEEKTFDILPDFCKLVHRATWLATCDLLLPMAKCSLLESLSLRNLSASLIGAVLELQLQYLYQNTRKSECRSAIRAILDDCLLIYPLETYPLRRARTLTRLMEWHISMSPNPRSDLTFRTLEQLSAEVFVLIEASNYGLDDGFRRFVQQHRASALMWLALAAQSIGMQEKFFDACELSLNVLGKIPLTPLLIQVQSPTTKEPSSKSRSRSTVKAKASSRTRCAVAKQDLFSNPLMTPTTTRTKSMANTSGEEVFLRQSNSNSNHRGNHSVSITRSANPLLLDDHDRHVQHLQLFAQILGAHGLISFKIRVLQFLKDLNSTQTPSQTNKRIESHISTIIELASTYLHCEDFTSASTLLSDAERIIKSSPMHTVQGSLASESLISLLYSRCFSEADDFDSANAAFTLAGEKWALATEEENHGHRNSDISSGQKVIARTKYLQMIALASFTYSHLKEKQGDLALAIEFATRAARLLQRASSNILRISNPPPIKAPNRSTEPDQEDVFSAKSKAQDCTPLPEVAREIDTHSFAIESHPVGEITWKIASMIPIALDRIISLYVNKGSPRMAEAYLNQLSTIADHIAPHRLKVCSQVTKANILVIKRQFDAAQEALKDASLMNRDRRSMEFVKILKLRCEISYKTNSFKEAKADCAELIRVLKELDYSCVLSPQPSGKLPGRSLDALSTYPITPAGSLLMAAQANRIQALVARAVRRPEQLMSALRFLSKMPYKVREKVFETTLLAMVQLDDVVRNFRVDPLLGVLPEAMVSIPANQANQRTSSDAHDQFPQLSRALKSMEELLTKRTIGCADIPNLYESIHVLITLKFMVSILERERKNVAGEIAALLDFASSITIRREMIESLQAKLRVAGPGDNTSWPSGIEVAIDCSWGVDLKRWERVAFDYQNEMSYPVVYRPPKGLPTGWQVISIHLAFDQDSLFIIQHNETCDPLALKLPLDRFNRREGEDSLFTFEAALDELKAIVSQSNAATQRARHVTGREQKVSWWQERKDLDIRMHDLVEKIENNWLGACKGFLRPSNKVNDKSALRSAMENIFRHHLISSPDNKNLENQPLDQNVVDCLISLPIDCRNEDLEDLVQFAVDSYQIHEAPVVGDEVDVDQVVCELRNLQVEFLVPYTQEESLQQHSFLILDKHLHGFPWEVFPILLGHSVSRIPSLSFLRDRLRNDHHALSTAMVPLTVDPSRTTYILNPSGDLTSTQSKFEEWLENQPTWNGIKGRPPSSEEVKQALTSANLMLYFGHGGAEQYIRSHTIKQLPRCAVTMLWGCSSGMLQDQGDFDPTGTPYSYMLAGCPSLLANLWDVTDKDIDKLAIDLFKRTGLHHSDHLSKDQSTLSLTSGLALARSSCQLKYLNGAAPIVYGIPVKFQSHEKK